MAFGHAGSGHSRELRPGAHHLDIDTAGITHGRAQAAHHLLNNSGDGALVGHPALDTFRHEFLGALGCVLEIAIATALGLRHGCQGTHAAVRFVGSALVELDFTRGLFSAGEHATHHDRVSTGDDGLGEVAGKSNPAIGDQGYAGTLERRRHIGNRRNLWHTGTGDNASGTDRTGTYTDFHGIRTGLGQRDGGLGGGDIATDNLHGRVG